MNKKGALELSVTTIIVVVLGVLFLIMGIFLLKTTMCAALHGIQKIDDLTMNQLRNLFGETNKISVIQSTNQIQKGINYGVAFGIKNTESSQKFSYEVTAIDLGNCNISKETAESFIVLGQKANGITIPIDSDYSGIVNFEIPSGIPNCNIRYLIDVKTGGDNYDTATFDVKIQSKSFSGSFC
jgi:hypothetical protein